MTKVYVFPADDHGCGHYRLIWPAQALRLEGWDIEIIKQGERDNALTGVVDESTGRLLDVAIPEDADVMVFQRVTHRLISQAIELIRAKGVAVVVDMDDDLAKIHPANPAFDFLHPKNSKYADHSWNNAQLACDQATMVVTATPALLSRYARHGRGMVFDNYVPGSMLNVQHNDSDMIGWAGSVHSHPDDLQAMGPSVNRLVQEGFQFANIGTGEGIRESWGLGEHVPLHISGAKPLQEWGQWVTKLGVGVAPLADTHFNAAKSWLKMAEYAATGVPCIGSPRAEYTRLHRLGIGWLAKDPKDWYRKMKLLATRADLREELSEQGREVMRTMTMEANAWKLGVIWDEALRLQRV